MLHWEGKGHCSSIKNFSSTKERGGILLAGTAIGAVDKRRVFGSSLHSVRPCTVLARTLFDAYLRLLRMLMLLAHLPASLPCNGSGTDSVKKEKTDEASNFRAQMIFNKIQ